LCFNQCLPIVFPISGLFLEFFAMLNALFQLADALIGLAIWLVIIDVAVQLLIQFNLLNSYNPLIRQIEGADLVFLPPVSFGDRPLVGSSTHSRFIPPAGDS
jgi:hypothetical protein